MIKKNSDSGKRLGLLVLVAIIIAGAGYFIYAFFQVRTVTADGNAMYTSAYVTALADIATGTHMFQINEDQVRSNIEDAEPYLRVVAVTRDYPDNIIVEVTERRPEAMMRYGDRYLLVDMDMVVLEMLPDRALSDRPEVTGMMVSSADLGSVIETEDSFKIAVLQEILRELDNREIYFLIDKIDLSNINNIRLTSVNGLRIRFGQAEKIAEKVKWIANRLPALERDGNAQGTLDVSAGSFATYSVYDASKQSEGSDQQASAAEPS